MYRVSALESQTLIFTAGPGSKPNSRRTPRGSRTTRDRYASLLYHAGEGPSSAIG
jgi:hypothetical protein